MTLDDIFPSLPVVAPAAERDAEFAALTAEASAAIQRIQDLAGRAQTEGARIRFPRGYLREAGRWRAALLFVRANNVRNNVAYTLMMHDVQAWVLKRTDLAGHARDMLVKGAIAVLGSIAEALLIDYTSPPMGRRQKFGSRVSRLKEAAVLDEELADELLWLWSLRNRQHIYELTAPEFNVYSPDDHPRAESAVARLIVAMQGAARGGGAKVGVKPRPKR